MNLSVKQKWVTIFLVAVILSISLLAAFKITGIIPEPPTPETIVLEAKSWSGERTSSMHSYNEWVTNLYSDNATIVSLEVAVCTYCAELGWAWTSYKYMDFHIVATANTSGGFIYSMDIEFYRGNKYTSVVDIIEDSYLLELHNLRLQKVLDARVETEAYVTTTAESTPKNCQLISNINWVFLNPDIDDNITVTLKTTYFNGTIYRKIIIPLHFSIRTDAGNSLDDPNVRQVVSGAYRGFLGPGSDHDDYYKIWVDQGNVITVLMLPPFDADYDLYLYGPGSDLNRPPEASSEARGWGTSECISYFVNSSGYWYIKVNYYDGDRGIYEFQVELDEYAPFCTFGMTKNM